MLIIKAGLFIDGTGSPPQHDVAIAVEDGRIESIVPMATVGEAEREVLDLSGATVLPGFIDTHVHLTFEPGPDHESVRATLLTDDPQTLALRAARNAQLALSAGVTTLRDCGGPGFVALRLRDAINNGLVIGPRVFAAGPAITTTAGHLNYLGLTADSKDEVVKAARMLAGAGADFVKVCATGGNMTPGSRPNNAQYDVDTLSALVADAHRLGLRVSAHAQGTAGIRNAVEAGVDFVEHCAWLGSDGEVEIDRAVLERIVEQGIYVGFTFPGVHREMLPGDDAREVGRSRRLEELQDKVVAYRHMLAAGARAMVSSDAGVRLTRFEDFVQSLEVMWRGCGVPPLDVIAAATRVPAEGLGLVKDLGTLEAGKLADLVAVEGDPIADLGALRRVRAVVRSGRVLVWQGRLVMGRQTL